MKLKSLFATLLVGLLTLTSCSKDEKEEKKPDPTERKKYTKQEVRNLDVKGDKWVYFSFEQGTILEVKDPQVDDKWDIAFNGYIVRLNGGSSGKGQAAALNTESKDFDKVTEIPQKDFVQDTENEIQVGYPDTKTIKISFSKELTGGFDIKNGIINIYPDNSQKWPSVYAPTKWVYVLKTTKGKFVKLQVTDCYNDRLKAVYLTFSYILSEDGKF